MKPATEAKLREAMEWCDENDKSTIFMIQYMMDSARVSQECVINFLYDETIQVAEAKRKETTP